VLDECALANLIADLGKRHAPINGVVHGAGVIEDKLLADKTSESWSRVVETKVLGLLLLQRPRRRVRCASCRCSARSRAASATAGSRTTPPRTN
jgi:NAD(P)-dependent dehydrogenase (short-subunit alcohol dehydrogenase family)